MNSFLIILMKTALLAVVMYISAGVLGCSPGVALVLASIPLVFMMLSVYTGFAFRLVALVFLAACAKIVVVDQDLSGRQIAGVLASAANEVRQTLHTVQP
ncbi:hypothetical protein [Paraburkholderia kururiensis]|uniref:hypothetical protein n=1 Tax=Paraburkholderia kururiensis TaxID=984307 RepID=UPI0018F74AB1|nr:hypothetical protein [Paraburkholderia kururiensis]